MNHGTYRALIAKRAGIASYLEAPVGVNQGRTRELPVSSAPGTIIISHLDVCLDLIHQQDQRDIEHVVPDGQDEDYRTYLIISVARGRGGVRMPSRGESAADVHERTTGCGCYRGLPVTHD